MSNYQSLQFIRKENKNSENWNFNWTEMCFHLKNRHFIKAFRLIWYSKLFHGSDIFLISLFFFLKLFYLVVSFLSRINLREWRNLELSCGENSSDSESRFANSWLFREAELRRKEDSLKQVYYLQVVAEVSWEL